MKPLVGMAQMRSILGQKYMQNDLKIGIFFVLAITFFPMHIFLSRFNW